MSHLDEMQLRELAAASGLPADDTTWTEAETRRWIDIVHDHENRESVRRLTNQLHQMQEAA